MPVILDTISWILKNVNVGVDGLNIGYGVRFVYSVVNTTKLINIKLYFFAFKIYAHVCMP